MTFSYLFCGLLWIAITVFSVVNGYNGIYGSEKRKQFFPEEDGGSPSILNKLIFHLMYEDIYYDYKYSERNKNQFPANYFSVVESYSMGWFIVGILFSIVGIVVVIGVFMGKIPL